MEFLQVSSLTASAAGDDFTGSDVADTFVAASVSRLQDADVLDGGLGIDTLTAKLNSTTTHDATINDIEIINFDVLGTSTVLANQIVGATNINLTGGAVLTLTNAKAGIAYSVAEAGTGMTLVQAGSNTAADTVTVNLGAGKLGTLTLGDSAGVEFDTINLVLDGTTSTTLTEATTPNFASTGESIVITGNGTTTISIDEAALGGNTTSASVAKATINAEGFDGTLILNIGANETENSDATKWTGVDVIALSTDDTGGVENVINNIQSGTSVTVFGAEAADNTLTVDPLGTATDDSITVTLAHATKGSSVVLAGLVADGYETLNIASEGTSTATSPVNNTLNDIAGLSSDKKIVISGSTKFTAAGIENTFTNISSTNTAGVDLTVDTGGALTFVGGAGADRIEFDTVADLTKLDAIAGGEGSDTIAFSAVPSAVSAAQLAVISGFEIIEFEATNTVASNFTLDIDGEAGLNTVYFNGELTTDSAKQITIQAVSGVKLKMGGHTATGSDNDDLIVDILGAENAGTDDTVTLELTNVDAASDAHAGLHIDNVENFVVELSGDKGANADVYTIADIDGAQLQDLTIVSTNVNPLAASDSLTITTAESTLLRSIDASAMTGALTISGLASKLIATGATIDGGSGIDTITGGAGADVIAGNKGADVLVGGAGNDAIDGGAGNDGITGGTGADSLTGGTGIDTFSFATGDSILTAYDKIADFGTTAADTTTYDILSTVGNTDDSASARTAATLESAATGTDLTSATSETDTGTVLGAITAAGKITFSGTSVGNVDTLAEAVAGALIMLSSATTIDTGDVASSIGFFEFGGNTYVVEETTTDVAATETVTSSVIELTGVTGITGMATTAAAGVITFA